MAPGDITNPFMSKSITASPTKGSSDGLSALREGLGRMNVVDRGSGEFALPEKSSRDVAKSRDLDRFVPSRSQSTSTIHGDTADSSLEASFADRSSASLSNQLGLPPSNRRILSFRAAPPPASHATSHLDAQRNYMLHSSSTANRGTGAAGSGAAAKKRVPPYSPERVLDAPGYQDDYYLNLVDWSSANRVAIGLGEVPYVWDAETGVVNALTSEGDEPPLVCSVSWSSDGSYLAVGNEDGQVEIWDVEENKRMRVMGGHSGRVASLSWNGHILSSGGNEGVILHHDVRISEHKVMELRGHSAEVCGLKWRPDGQLLASGGNDNVVNCWDGRTRAAVLSERVVPKWTKRNHTAAVKALAWCPWQPNLLASGGGTQDQHIHFWSTTTGARTASLATGSQVTSLVWSPHSKEILSTHGYPNYNFSVWSYPGLQKIYDVPAHDSRVLASALSPDGCSVATGAGDENLKFWRVWEPRAVKKVVEDRDARGMSKVRIR